MLIPTYPHESPEIDEPGEGGIAPLLMSIALEEASLSESINKYMQNVCNTVKTCYDDRLTVQKAIEINSGIFRFLKDILKQLILLLFKLEDILELINTKTSDADSSAAPALLEDNTSTAEIKPTSKQYPAKSCNIPETAFYPSDHSTKVKTWSYKEKIYPKTAPKHKKSVITEPAAEKADPAEAAQIKIPGPISYIYKYRDCVLKGRTQGHVSNKNDFFYGGIAIVRTCIDFEADSYGGDRLLFYCARKGTATYIFRAYPVGLEIDCTESEEVKTANVKGIGLIIIKEPFKRNITGVGIFSLTVWGSGSELEPGGFLMSVRSAGGPRFNHNSGIVNSVFPDIIINNIIINN